MHTVWRLLAISLILSVGLTGCRKKVVQAPAPPPEPVAVEKPKVEAPRILAFSAEPSSISAGNSSRMSWSVTGAEEIEITPGIGKVEAEGSVEVRPSTSTTYILSAKGPGGEATRSLTLNVFTPAPEATRPAVVEKVTLAERLAREVRDAYFDYDQNSLNAEARSTLEANAAALRTILNEFPAETILIEGHCDERGSAEYNLGLGDRRAQASLEFLSGLGLSRERFRLVSFGKEKPQCTDENEACYRLNRRVHFSVDAR